MCSPRSGRIFSRRSRLRFRCTLLLGSLAIAPALARAQGFAPEGLARPTVVHVTTPDGVTAAGTSVSVLGFGASASADWTGRALLPPFQPGDYLLLLERFGESPMLVGVSAIGLADSFAVRLVRRRPRVGDFTTVNNLPPELLALDARRSQALGQLLAGQRLRQFGSVRIAAAFLAGPAIGAEACIRVGEDGRAPAGARLRPLWEPAYVLRGNGAIVASAGRTEPDDQAHLNASPESLQAIEWFDSRLVPALFEGIPVGCHVLFLWH